MNARGEAPKGSSERGDGVVEAETATRAGVAAIAALGTRAPSNAAIIAATAIHLSLP